MYSLLKGELVALLIKTGLESDCKKCTKKRHSNLNRTELGDYLLSKIKNTEQIVAVTVGSALDTAVVVPETLAAINLELPAAVIDFVATTYEGSSNHLYSKYSSNHTEIASCLPSIEDRNLLHAFYLDASENNNFLTDAVWYKHRHFKI